MCLGNISGNFLANKMKKKKTVLNECVSDFSADVGLLILVILLISMDF